MCASLSSVTTFATRDAIDCAAAASPSPSDATHAACSASCARWACIARSWAHQPSSFASSAVHARPPSSQSSVTAPTALRSWSTSGAAIALPLGSPTPSAFVRLSSTGRRDCIARSAMPTTIASSSAPVPSRSKRPWRPVGAADVDATRRSAPATSSWNDAQLQPSSAITSRSSSAGARLASSGSWSREEVMAVVLVVISGIFESFSRYNSAARGNFCAAECGRR